MTLNEAINDAELLKELEAKSNKLQDWIDAIKDRLKAFLAEQGETSMVLGNHKVSHADIVTHRFDTKSFKEAHEDLYQQFEVASSIKRFAIR